MMRGLLLLAILILPVTVGAEQTSGDALMNLYAPHQGEGRNDLNQPHRSNGQLADYLANVGVELFTVTQSGMKEELLANQKYFKRDAFRQYLQFLQNSGYLPVMQELSLNMTGLSESPAVLLSKGVHEDAYHWIYPVPITVILGGNRALPESRLPRPEVITLRIQIGRDATGPEPNFILIHDFQVGNRDQSLPTEGDIPQ